MGLLILGGHVKRIKSEGKIVAAEIIVYAGDDEEFFSFITPEAYHHLEKWMNYRAECGEYIDEESWIMRQLWNTKEGRYHHGCVQMTKLEGVSQYKRACN